MLPLRLRLANGEIIEMRRAPGGGFACPVCGLDFGASCEPAWLETDPVIDGLAAGTPSYNICPDCRTQYGLDDGPPGEADPSTAVATAWAELRLAWLERNGWPDEALHRLRDNLGVDIVALREHLARRRGLPPPHTR